MNTLKLKLQKIAYALIVTISIVLMILAILHSQKPEWFDWLPGFLGNEMTNQVLTLLGFGGSAGVLGFILNKSMALQNLSDMSKLKIQSEEVVVNVVSKVTDGQLHLEKEMNKFIGITTDRYEAIEIQLKDQINETKEANNKYDKLLSLVTSLVLDKAENPLTNPEARNRLLVALDEASNKTIKTNEKEEEVIELKNDDVK